MRTKGQIIVILDDERKPVGCINFNLRGKINISAGLKHLPLDKQKIIIDASTLFQKTLSEI